MYGTPTLKRSFVGEDRRSNRSQVAACNNKVRKRKEGRRGSWRGGRARRRGEKRGRATGGSGQRRCGRVLSYYAPRCAGGGRLAVVVLGSKKVRSAQDDWRGLSPRG